MRTTLLLAPLLLAGALVVSVARAAPAADAANATPGSPSKTRPKVTFLELGSVGCRPCDAMQPVMQAVREKYGRQVEVTFHDVKKNPSIARQWGIHLIPTQIFLDAEGKEVFRHQGYFALGEVEKVLKSLGVP